MIKYYCPSRSGDYSDNIGEESPNTHSEHWVHKLIIMYFGAWSKKIAANSRRPQG